MEDFERIQGTTIIIQPKSVIPEFQAVPNCLFEARGEGEGLGSLRVSLNTGWQTSIG